MDIYKGSTATTIVMNVGTDITGATALIKYKKPSGIVGSWTGTITNAASGIYEYQITSSDFPDGDEGRWFIWSHITFADTTVGIGAPQKMTILEEGQLPK